MRKFKEERTAPPGRRSYQPWSMLLWRSAYELFVSVDRDHRSGLDTDQAQVSTEGIQHQVVALRGRHTNSKCQGPATIRAYGVHAANDSVLDDRTVARNCAHRGKTAVAVKYGPSHERQRAGRIGASGCETIPAGQEIFLPQVVAAEPAPEMPDKASRQAATANRRSFIRCCSLS
jgi:hypothetical protein